VGCYLENHVQIVLQLRNVLRANFFLHVMRHLRGYKPFVGISENFVILGSELFVLLFVVFFIKVSAEFYAKFSVG
jgi:hypothetical protein